MASNGTREIERQIGQGTPRTDDPAWKPPTDPLADKKINPAVVRREVPIQVVGTGWDIAAVRTALDQQVLGQFDWPAQLCDSMIADSRVQSALRSRVGGLLGRPVDFRVPRKWKDSSAAKECRDAFADAWDTMASKAVLGELQRWAIMLGFGLSQLLWSMGGDYAVPIPYIWHPRFTYWHWTFRRLIAQTLDGPAVVTGGDGHWLFNAPHGDRDGYRSWMQGADRAIGPWWLARHYALRDAARWSEKHGFPIVKAKTPARGDPEQIDRWRSDLQTLGQEAVIQIPQEVDPRASYDVEYLETQDQGHEVFGGLIELCNTEITLSLQSEILTSTIGPEGRGSYAAARVHGDTKQTLIEADADALQLVVRQQLGRPFALMNFDEAEMAPAVVWDVSPYEDAKTRVETFAVLTQGLNVLRQAGIQVDDVAALARSFGLNLGQISNITKGAEIFQYDLEYGIATVNEARERKGLPPIKGGDVPPAPAAPKEGTAKARFAAAAEEIGRLRVKLGETSAAQVEAETAALIEYHAGNEAELARALHRAAQRAA